MEASLDAALPFGHGRRVSPPRENAADGDARLVAAARAGDRGAFGRLYARYSPMVHGLLLAKVPLAAVDDLVHDVFLAAMGKIGTLRDDDAFGGWLAAIARNCARDHHRRAPAEDELTQEPAVEQPDRLEALAVLDAIRGLPDAYSETLILRLVEGLTGPEIAERCGLTPGSVRVNLHRGMKLLKEKLGTDDHD